MSIYDSGYQNLRDHARRYGVSSIQQETGWSENHDATADFMKQEMLSTSEQMMIGDQVNQAATLYRDSIKDPNKDKLGGIELGNVGMGALHLNKQYLEDNHQAILDLQVQYPEAGFKTIDDIMKDAQEKARLTRESMSKVSANSSGLGKLGVLTGGFEGFLHDPILVGSMLLGAKKITGPSKAINAWKAFKTEAAIAAGAEMLITPSVMSWKDELNSPYSLKDATINILTIGAFAGVTRAGGSYVVDVFEARKAISSLRAAGKDGEADVVESYVNLQEKGINNQDAHIQAYKKAQEALDSGKIVEQAELDKITGGNIGLESIDPKTVEVDASTFQFKSRGDEFGVTDRLQGVKKWDSIKAGTSIVWERADGARFIADGHQRLALAKRLIGDDAQEVGLNAFIMREADGYTAEAVRDIAAFKNIAEGSGSALDAAKVIRSGRVLDEALPTNSALVRDAQGLSKLDDASFRLVIDEKIDAKYGAIVGELVSNADEQAAVIRALMKEKPANINQAKIMVSDMKAAGFTKTETQDLFGGMEITESLFKERAKVIDSAMRQIKKDKSVFKTLAEQESRIAGAGNKLDRDANLLRLSDDEKTLATLTSLANAKGPVSDAINDAARRVKSGESIQRATRDILPELRRSTEPGSDVRPNRDGAGDGQPTLIPEKGKPVRLQDLNDVEVEKVEREFKTKQKELNLTPGQYRKAAQTPQKQIVTIGKELEDAMGESIAFLNPGIKDLLKIKDKIKNKGYDGTGDLTDVVRAGFAVKEASDMPQIIEKISKRYEILDEGIVVNAAGYIDQKILVRFDNGLVGEIQLWEPHILAAKEGADFVRDVFPKHLQEYVSDMDIPPRKDSGHDLYERQRSLLEGGKVKPGKGEEFKALEKSMKDLYADANRFSKTSWNDALESGRPESRISNGEIISHSPGSDDVRINQPSSKPSDGSTVTAGRPSQLKNAETSLKSNDAINKSSTDIIPKDTDSIKLNQINIHRSEQKPQNLRKQLDEVRRGVVGDKLTAGGTLATQTGRETTPFPKLDNSSHRKALNTSARVDKWLIENAIAEAKSRGDKFNLRQFEQDLPLTKKADNLPQASRDSAELYLFGEDIPVARQSSLRELDTTAARAKLNDQLKDSGLDLDDPYLNDLNAKEQQLVNDLLENGGDFEIPTGAKLDVDGNEVLEFRSAKEVMKELDDEQKVIDDMFKCMGE